MQQVSLHVPSYDELWYRQKLMADPATMSYNRGYSLPFEEYDKNTGCIAFLPKTRIADAFFELGLEFCDAFALEKYAFNFIFFTAPFLHCSIFMLIA